MPLGVAASEVGRHSTGIRAEMPVYLNRTQSFQAPASRVERRFPRGPRSIMPRRGTLPHQ